MTEGKHLAIERLWALGELPDEELERYVEDSLDTRLPAPSGAVYRLRIEGGHGKGEWDDDPDLWIRVLVTGRWLRWWQRNEGSVDRFASDSMASLSGTEGPRSVWVELLGGAMTLAFLLALIVPWFVGVGFVTSRLV